jgi:hypothetical protein
MPPSPEIQLSYSAAGRETLALIAEEPGPRDTLRVGFDDAPEVTVVASPAGRETLALISDLARPMRAEQPTLNYGDRISNAPGATTPSQAPKLAPRSTPFAIFQTLSFVIEGLDRAQLTSDDARRAFLAEHLLERLPERDLSRVARSELSADSATGFVLTVWCKI